MRGEVLDGAEALDVKGVGDEQVRIGLVCHPPRTYQRALVSPLNSALVLFVAPFGRLYATAPSGSANSPYSSPVSTQSSNWMTPSSS